MEITGNKDSVDRSQKYGQELSSFKDVEEAWKKADALEERLFVKLVNGRVIEVERAINHPVQPVVVGVEYKNESDPGEEVRLQMIDDFLARHPVVVDQEKLFEKPDGEK
jgi:hypothetical protein